MDIYNVKYDIVGNRKIWFALSAIIIGLSLIFMIRNVITDKDHHSPLRLGIDFTGGVITQVQFNSDEVDLEKVSTEKIFRIVAEITSKEPLVQITHNAEGKLVHIRADHSLIEEANRKKLFDRLSSEIGSNTEIMSEEITPVISHELIILALQGLFWGSILILIYVSLRMAWDFAVFGVLALVHDILVICGAFAFLQKEINSYFVAVVLTIVGFSINDTIVIYDRIRENSKINRTAPFDKVVNASLVQTMNRTINTSLTVQMTVLALYFFGGVSLRDFSLALTIGLLSGAYSSIFVAAQLLVSYRLYKAKGRMIRAEETLKPEELLEVEEETDESLLDEEERGKKISTASKKKRKRRY